MIGDLTTLANVTAWLNAGSTAPYPPDGNPLLARLITACSAFIQNYLSLSFVPTVQTEAYNGTGQPVLFLRKRPVIGVSTISINGTAVQASPAAPNQNGFLSDDTRVYLYGWLFARGFQNISVTYTSGYQQQFTQSIPTDGVLSTIGFPFPWNADMGITVNGVALTAILSGSPAQGEYIVSVDAGGYPIYTFNTADAASSAVITYGYTPYDIEQVCVEVVGEAFKRRSRIGQTSVNMADGQVVNFSLKDFNDMNKSILNQYKNVVPA